MSANKQKPVVYVYDDARGAGIPGLPHAVTEAEAAALGVLDLLKQAIENGAYAVKEQ